MRTADEAAVILGVPAVQIRRWAATRTGPKNSGNWFTPKYADDDLTAWLDAHRKASQRLDTPLVSEAIMERMGAGL